MENVAEKKDLPHIFAIENDANIPYYAILIIAALAAIPFTIGSLGMLVDAVSLIFLITFGIVNFLGYRQKVKYRIFCLLGALGCLLVMLLSSYEQLQTNPLPLLTIVALVLLVIIGR